MKKKSKIEKNNNAVVGSSLSPPSIVMAGPKGLTRSIPVNGPTCILRGAVFRDESYENHNAVVASSSNSNLASSHPQQKLGISGESVAISAPAVKQQQKERQTNANNHVSFSDNTRISAAQQRTPVGVSPLAVGSLKTGMSPPNTNSSNYTTKNGNTGHHSSSLLGGRIVLSPLATAAIKNSSGVNVGNGGLLSGGNLARPTSSALSASHSFLSASSQSGSFSPHSNSRGGGVESNGNSILLAHQQTPLDHIAASAERFIQSELNLLDASSERDLVGYRAAVAQAYCQGVRMMLPHIGGALGGSGGGGGGGVGSASPLNYGGSRTTTTVAGSSGNKITLLIEKCLKSFEDSLIAAAHAASQPTRSADERNKMEQELKVMYMQASEERAKELQKLSEEIENNSTNSAQRVFQLENQLITAKQEIQRLRAVQNEDSERFSNMTQSVLESRIAAQRAEIALQEMKDRYDRVKVTEMVYMDLLRDHQDMNLLLREKRIPFKTRIHFSVDDLLSEPNANVLANHAATIRARQQEEIDKKFDPKNKK